MARVAPNSFDTKFTENTKTTEKYFKPTSFCFFVIFVRFVIRLFRIGVLLAFVIAFG